MCDVSMLLTPPNNTPIEELDPTVLVYDFLKRKGINTFDDLNAYLHAMVKESSSMKFIMYTDTVGQDIIFKQGGVPLIFSSGEAARRFLRSLLAEARELFSDATLERRPAWMNNKYEEMWTLDAGEDRWVYSVVDVDFADRPERSEG